MEVKTFRKKLEGEIEDYVTKVLCQAHRKYPEEDAVKSANQKCCIVFFSNLLARLTQIGYFLRVSSYVFLRHENTGRFHVHGK